MEQSTRRRRTEVRLVLAVVAVAATALVACEPTNGSLQRPADPVVLTGADLPRLVGAPVGQVVAFRWADGSWAQVPVQVDERKTVLVSDVYAWTNSNTDIPITTYADPGTFVGADEAPGLDADDEVALRAADAGGRAPAGTAIPGGTAAASGVEVQLDDPLASGQRGWLYLFRTTGGLQPSAGKAPIGYTFDLLSGDYKTTYQRADGPNPEDSTVQASTYTAHFSDRWLFDGLTLAHGDRPTTDLIDRLKYRLVLGQCGRSEDTFDDAEGAFIVNRSGPVRALRGYVGANSGPNTQAVHAFYDTRIDTVIDLRVHAIPGVAAYLDHATSAYGMTFRNAQVPNGVPVDGVDDVVPAGSGSWSTMIGPQGVLAVGQTARTNLGITPSTWYEDDAASPTDTCTGDGQAVAESGARFGAVACTDPDDGCSGTLQSRISMVAAPAGVSPAIAQRWAEQANTPLVATTTPFG